MRILFFSTAFPQPHEPSRNPDNLERCLALARDHDVHVMSPLHWLHGRGVRVAERFESGRMSLSRPRYYYPPGLLRRTHAWCMWQSIRRTAVRTVAHFQPQVVVSYWTYPDGAVAANLAQLGDVPCVAIVGGSDVLSLDPAASSARAQRVTRVLHRVDAVAAVSDSLKQRMVALGVSAGKVHVLPPAVDKQIFCPGSRDRARRRLAIPLDAPVIVWIGRMVAVKALDVLLEATAELSRTWPRVRLYLMGDGPLRRSLEAMVTEKGLARHVIFTGRIPHRALPDYYRAADVTVLPSHWEGMPNAVLEAQACGIPFVASAVGAIPQLANPGVDELVSPGDYRQLADALATVLGRSSEGRGRAMCRAGGWDHSAACLTDLLEAACHVRRVSSPHDRGLLM